MIRGITPNCKHIATPLMEAKNLPIQPALIESTGRASLNLVTKQTFKSVANPCPARISINSAFKTGSLENNPDALRINP